MNIQLGLSSINNSNLLSETDSEIPIEEKHSKKIVQKKNTDKINDILMPEREIEESKSNQKDNLKKTKVLEISINPFIKKIKKKALI